MSNVYFANTKAACCSAGGGQHWTIGDTSGDLDGVTSGDLVIAGNLVGVALGDYDTDQDRVVLDVTGCYELTVTGHDTAGSDTAIAIGDWLYYDSGASEINRDYANGICIGQAMAAVASGEEDEICVKLWPTPWADILLAAT